MAALRILVAIDASPGSLLACQQAAELAASMRAELIGLFVEDIDLLRSAQLPTTFVIGTTSAARRKLSVAELGSQMRAQAERARRALEDYATRLGLPWSFRVARGSVTALLRTAAAEADFLSLGRAGWTFPPFAGLGSTLRALLAAEAGRLLISHPSRAARGPVRVLLGGVQPVDELVAEGLRLAQAADLALEMLLLGDQAPLIESATRRARELATQGMTVHTRLLVGATELPVAAAASSVLVVGADLFRRTEELIDVLGQLACPVLVVRRQPAGAGG